MSDLEKKALERREKLRAIKRHNKARYRELAKAKKVSLPESGYAAEMADEGDLLEIQDLHTCFFTDIGTVKAIDGVSFSIPAGSTLGVVGESGCGKSVTSLSILRILQEPQGQITSGRILFRRKNTGRVVDLVKVPLKEMQKIRGGEISMIFQEPMTTLNPVFTVGSQIDEAVSLHDSKLGRRELRTRSIRMLDSVGIANAQTVYRMYPHELSGGMRQRVVIAMAMACDPALIIADEPTTALDVTVQAQILDLLRQLKGKISSSIMLITHDLGVVAEMADHVVVMYAGRIVESGTVRDIFHDPRHPYTLGLMASRPNLSQTWGTKLPHIPGNVPNPIDLPDYCYFRNRCGVCRDECSGSYPGVTRVSPTHSVSCWASRPAEDAQEGGRP